MAKFSFWQKFSSPKNVEIRVMLLAHYLNGHRISFPVKGCSLTVAYSNIFVTARKVFATVDLDHIFVLPEDLLHVVKDIWSTEVQGCDLLTK